MSKISLHHHLLLGYVALRSGRVSHQGYVQSLMLPGDCETAELAEPGLARPGSRCISSLSLSAPARA